MNLNDVRTLLERAQVHCGLFAASIILTTFAEPPLKPHALPEARPGSSPRMTHTSQLTSPLQLLPVTKQHVVIAHIHADINVALHDVSERSVTDFTGFLEQQVPLEQQCDVTEPFGVNNIAASMATSGSSTPTLQTSVQNCARE